MCNERSQALKIQSVSRTTTFVSARYAWNFKAPTQWQQETLPPCRGKAPWLCTELNEKSLRLISIRSKRRRQQSMMPTGSSQMWFCK